MIAFPGRGYDAVVWVEPAACQAVRLFPACVRRVRLALASRRGTSTSFPVGSVYARPDLMIQIAQTTSLLTGLALFLLVGDGLLME
jgi:hypothetical protein